MVVLLNGAFGIGKTTAARLVVRSLPRAMVFDPERLGFVLQRARRLTGRPIDDFQDLAVWRRWLVLGVRAALRARSYVVVPMAFSNLAYLDEIRGGLSRFEPEVRHLCLVAPLAVVEERLRLRGADLTDPRAAWQYRRAAECCAAHAAAAFAEHLPTAGLTARQTADLVLSRVRPPD